MLLPNMRLKLSGLSLGNRPFPRLARRRRGGPVPCARALVARSLSAIR
jgi:hypothetical protein